MTLDIIAALIFLIIGLSVLVCHLLDFVRYWLWSRIRGERIEDPKRPGKLRSYQQKMLDDTRADWEQGGLEPLGLQTEPPPRPVPDDQYEETTKAEDWRTPHDGVYQIDHRGQSYQQYAAAGTSLADIWAEVEAEGIPPAIKDSPGLLLQTYARALPRVKPQPDEPNRQTQFYADLYDIPYHRTVCADLEHWLAEDDATRRASEGIALGHRSACGCWPDLSNARWDCAPAADPIKDIELARAKIIGQRTLDDVLDVLGYNHYNSARDQLNPDWYCKNATYWRVLRVYWNPES